MRTLLSVRSLLIVALGLGALSGCSPLVCTLAGWGSGLTVQLTSLPTKPYSVEVLIPGTQELVYSYECGADQGCQPREEITFYIYFDEPVLTHFLVRVTTVTGSRVTEFRDVRYGRTYPNGRDCPPCPDTTVIAEVPA